jgi:hypothetical protein
MPLFSTLATASRVSASWSSELVRLVADQGLARLGHRHLARLGAAAEHLAEHLLHVLHLDALGARQVDHADGHAAARRRRSAPPPRGLDAASRSIRRNFIRVSPLAPRRPGP